MDERTEALLGPERAPDPAEARALEREVEEEDFALRVRLAGRAAPLLLFFLIILFPVAHSLFGLPGAWSLFGWAFLNLPLITLAILALRRGRLPLGGVRFLTGSRARKAAFGMLALSLFLSCGLAVTQAIWGWLGPAGR